MSKEVKNLSNGDLKLTPKGNINIKPKSNITIKPQEFNNNNIIKKEFILEGLGCANCAAKIEDKVSKINGIN